MSANWLVLCGLLLGVAWVCTSQCNGENFEKKLITQLLAVYDDADRIARPVDDHTQVLQLNVGMFLIRIVDFDDDKSAVTVNAWNFLSWKDSKLDWDPGHYGGVKDIRLPATKVWTPDFYLFNGVTDPEELRETLVLIKSDGTLLWVPQLEWTIPCDRTSRDNYNCTFSFGSWTMHKGLLDVNFYDKADLDVTALHPNPFWQVTGHSAWRATDIFDCCPNEVYPSIKFSITLQRGCDAPGADGTCGGH